MNAAETADRLAIHELIGMHGHLVDTGELDRLAEVFAVDVRYDLTDLGGDVVAGLDTLVALSLATGDRNPVGHHVTNVVVETLTAGTATARSKAIAVMSDGTAGSAVYLDDLARGPDGWRITHRTVRARRKPLTP